MHLLVNHVGGAPRRVGVQQAVHGAEPAEESSKAEHGTAAAPRQPGLGGAGTPISPGWVLLDGEGALHVDGVALVFEHAVAQRHLGGQAQRGEVANVAIRMKQRKGELQSSPHFPNPPLTLCIIPQGRGFSPLLFWSHVNQYLSHDAQFLGDNLGYLFVDLRLGHLVEVLQVGVEEVAADELHAQHGLDDVADGAVVGQADLLCSAHEVTPTAGRQTGAAEEQSPGDVGTLQGSGVGQWVPSSD